MNEIDLDDLPYGTWMKASPMRANMVTGIRKVVKIGIFRRRLLENTRKSVNRDQLFHCLRSVVGL